jgi:hypothetical protein
VTTLTWDLTPVTVKDAHRPRRNEAIQEGGFRRMLTIEDGIIWVYGVGEHGIQAFTDLGIEDLIELVRMYKENPTWLNRPTD